MRPAAGYAAFLRVYEPLTAFPEPERRRWEHSARDPRDVEPDLLSSVLGVPPVVVPPVETAEVRAVRVDGVTLVSPVRLRRRSLLALEELRRELPAPVLEMLVPPAALDAVESDLAQLRGEADQRVHVRTSTWQVPVAWFVIVADEERDVVPRGRPAGPLLRYRTPMVESRRRMARAVRVLRSFPTLTLTGEVEELGRWLEEFHPRSLVELDYGGLAELLPDEALHSDHSPADVAAGLTALRDGDLEEAGRRYEALLLRWRPVAALEHAS